jgi:uncharacterized protein (TIGR03000 family)
MIMVRRWFSIAGVLAFAGVMLAGDAAQAGPLQRLRDRLRGRSGNEESSSRFGFRRSYYRNGEQVVAESTVTGSAVAANQAALDIRVPSNAEVWVNETKISQTGTMRTYSADNLTAGQTYSYKIKAEWTGQGGKKEKKERTVEVRPGERKTVDFNRMSTGRSSPEQLKEPKEPKEPKEND